MVSKAIISEIPAYRSDRSYKRKPVIVLATYNRGGLFYPKGTTYAFGKYRNKKTAQQVIDTQARKWSFLDLSIKE